MKGSKDTERRVWGGGTSGGTDVDRGPYTKGGWIMVRQTESERHPFGGRDGGQVDSRDDRKMFLSP